MILGERKLVISSEMHDALKKDGHIKDGRITLNDRDLANWIAVWVGSRKA